MADLSVNKSDTTGLYEDTGNNRVINGNFESTPSFTAATTTTGKWIDGTATGSSTNDIYRWSLNASVGSQSAQFDTATFNSGSASIKVSTAATASSTQVSNALGTSSVGTNQPYFIPIIASTSYKVTYFMKTTVNSGAATSGAFLQLAEFGASGSALVNHAGTKIATTTSFTQYTISFTSNASAVYGVVELIVKGNDGTATLVMDAWFDDIVFQQVNPPNTPNVLLFPIVTPGIQDISGPKIWS